MCQKCNNCNICNCQNKSNVNLVVCKKQTTKIVLLKPTENSEAKVNNEQKNWIEQNISSTEEIIIIKLKDSSEKLKNIVVETCKKLGKKFEIAESQIYYGDYK